MESITSQSEVSNGFMAMIRRARNDARSTCGVSRLQVRHGMGNPGAPPQPAAMQDGGMGARRILPRMIEVVMQPAALATPCRRLHDQRPEQRDVAELDEIGTQAQ